MANLSDLAQTPTPGMLGSGLAQMAGSAMQNRNAYKKYAIEKQSAGETPLTYEEWVNLQNG